MSSLRVLIIFCYAILCYFGTFSADLQVALNQTGLEMLMVLTLPILHDFILSQTINVKTVSVSTPDIQIHLDPINFVSVSSGTVIAEFNENNQNLDIKIAELDIMLRRFKFEVDKKLPLGRYKPLCTGYTTPNISNWNVSLHVLVLHDELCILRIETDKSQIWIVEGVTTFNFEDCETWLEIAGSFVDIEKVIKDEVIKEVLKFIDKQLETIINGLLEQILYFELDDSFSDPMNESHSPYLEICLTDFLMVADAMYIAMDLSSNVHDQPAITKAPDDDIENDVDIREADDLTLLIVFIICCIFLWFWGFGCIFCVKYCWTVYTKKKKAKSVGNETCELTEIND